MIAHFGEIEIAAHQTVDVYKDIEDKLCGQPLGVGVGRSPKR